MSSVTVYVLDDDGYLDCIRSGDANSVMLAVDIEEKDFTMQMPPNDTERCRWLNNKWIIDK